jgi:hypothetical protein
LKPDKVEDASKILILMIRSSFQYTYVDFQFNSGSDFLKSASD